MSIPCVFELGDAVSIRGNHEIRGVIDGILLTAGGMEYRFINWDEDGMRQLHWVSAFELNKIKSLDR